MADEQNQSPKIEVAAIKVPIEPDLTAFNAALDAAEARIERMKTALAQVSGGAVDPPRAPNFEFTKEQVDKGISVDELLERMGSPQQGIDKVLGGNFKIENSLDQIVQLLMDIKAAMLSDEDS